MKSAEYTNGCCYFNKLCGRPPQYAPAPCKLTFDLLTMKVVSESRVTWATSVPILVFLGSLFSVCQTDARRASSLNASYLRGGGIIIHFRRKMIKISSISLNPMRFGSWPDEMIVNYVNNVNVGGLVLLMQVCRQSHNLPCRILF